MYDAFISYDICSVTPHGNAILAFPLSSLTARRHVHFYRVYC
jgi:hypothetical protein